ncbi:MAG TPA: ABC transporter permease, partial [Chitinophagaceae bacterium]|nr:ABC transporter permease [Chitinophagaceae bacterium]
MLKNYLKTTFRNLWRNKVYSFLNIVGLATGIACAGLIFLWAEDEMTFDKMNIKKDRLYSVQVNKIFAGNMYTMGSTPRPLAASLKAEIPGIVNAARISDDAQRMLFSFGDKSLYASGRYADPSLFNMFTLPFVQGNAETAFRQLYSLVITERTAKKFFGDDKNVLGKMVRLDNKQDFVVTGVLKDLPENATLQFEWLAPYETNILQRQARWGGNDALNWESFGPFTYVELEAKASAAAINNKLKNFIYKKAPVEKSEVFLFPMSNWRLYSEFENGKPTGSGRIKQVHLLSAIAWIILFIGCINFMNLATANGQQRAKEVGVRKVLGAGKKRLIVQFIGETFLLSAIAAALAIVIISLALPAFNILMQKNLSLGLDNPYHSLALFIIIIICGLVAGSYPSLYLSSFNPAFVLKGLKLKTGSAAFIRKGLVVFQFTVSVVFIICTIIVYMQIAHVKNRQLGFNRNNLIEIDMQHDVTKDFLLIKQDLLRTGTIENAALSDHTTMRGGDTDDRFLWQGKPADNQISIAFRNISPEFVATSGMQISEGRDFGSNAAAESSNIIITESMAKIMGKESAIAKIIQSPRGNEGGHFTNMNVVGIVKDYVYGNMYGAPGPVIFFCMQSKNANLVYVRVKPNIHITQALAKIEAVMKKDNPAYPLQYKFADDQFNEMFLNEMLISRVSGIFAVLAIVISCLGLFGLATYTAAQRIKEIGIRKVLGASVAGIASLLSKDFIKLVAVSCLVAFPVAWWIMHSWLRNYQYRIKISPWIFIAAGAVALLVALITISFQA